MEGKQASEGIGQSAQREVNMQELAGMSAGRHLLTGDVKAVICPGLSQ